MNPYVTDPAWHWWIILYFFLGGIAAGAYFLATLIEMMGSPADRPVARAGYRVAFPLISLCGLLLIVDLNQPGRFWHMLFRSEVVHEALREGWPGTGHSWRVLAGAPLLKYWSPMSIGSWALAVFGLCSGLSFLGSLWPDGRLERVLLRSWFGRLLQGIGVVVGFFVAAYTGTLLTVTSQPVWSDTTWIAPLFLTSAASTGIAVLILLSRRASPAVLERLGRADLWALGLELVVFVVFLGSLGPFLGPVLRVWQGLVLVIGTLVVGLLLPLVFQWRGRATGPGMTAAVLALVGGFLLRYGLLTTPPALLTRVLPETEAGARRVVQDMAVLVRVSPEDGREPGGGPGADPGNRSEELQPRSKVFGGPTP